MFFTYFENKNVTHLYIFGLNLLIFFYIYIGVFTQLILYNKVIIYYYYSFIIGIYFVILLIFHCNLSVGKRDNILILTIYDVKNN